MTEIAGYKVGFKELVLLETVYDERSIQYTYDALSRLIEADHAFTGEPRDANGLQHHRARCYAPGLAVWTALDPFEGYEDEPMSLNGYSYVHGNPINLTDPSGEIPQAAAVIAVLTAAAGAIVGGVVSAGGAAFVTGLMYELAISGNCGCDAQQWALNTNKADVQAEAALKAGILGAVLGAASVVGYAQVAALLGLGAGTLGAAASAVDMLHNGANDCNKLSLLLSLLGIATAGYAASGGGFLPPTTMSVSVPVSGGNTIAWSTVSVTVGGVSLQPGLAVAGAGVSVLGLDTALGNFVFSDSGGDESELRPYGGPGGRGGHHIHAKRAFRGNSKYNANRAPALPKKTLDDNTWSHGSITTRQRALFRQLGRDVDARIKHNTLEEHSRIAREALEVLKGLSRDRIDAWVTESENWLLSQGITEPNCIPWWNC